MKARQWLSSLLGGDRAWVASFLERYDALDRALQGAGFPATSPWWRAQIELFMRRGCRRWVIRAGRRAGKSSTLCRLATAWALWGGWSVPPGDVAVVAFVSIDRDEAGARVRTIGDILRTLGISIEQRSDEIELRDRRLCFRVITGNTRATVGFTSIAIFGDEMARWESRDTAANPAREVMASLRPTMATQPLAFEVCSSSPWSVDDYHAELFDAGTDEHQLTSFAQTWIANQTITEEQTKALEPDERLWSREYAAEPGIAISAAFDTADVARCYGRTPRGQLGAGFVAIDASSLRGDTFAFICGRFTDAREIVVSEVCGWQDAELRKVSMSQIVISIADRAKAWGTDIVFGDQREEASLTSMFREHAIKFISYAWSESSKDDAVMALRRTMREDRVHLCEHELLRRQLTNVKARLLPSGRTKYMTNGLDFASALITLAHADVAGHITYVKRSIVVDYKNALIQYHSPIAGGDFGLPSGRDEHQFPPAPGPYAAEIARYAGDYMTGKHGYRQ